jgi:hypothetical protein
MPLTEQLKTFIITKLPGMNSLAEDLDLEDRWVKQANNCRFEPQPHSIDKRDPVTHYNEVVAGVPTSIGSGPMLGLYRFYTSTGVIKFVGVHGTSCYVGDDATGTWTAIRTSLTEGKRISFETYKDQVIMSNGFDAPFVYDGSSDNVTWELGSCKAVLGTGAGNLDPSATYYYAISFDSDTVNSGAVSNTVTTDGSNQQIELTNIPLGPVGTTNRKIWRTNGDGSTLFLIDEIINNTQTTYTDNIADTDTTVLTTGTRGDPFASVTDSIPLGSILKIHRERLFISGDPTYPNKIYYSAVYLPHYILQNTNDDFMEISPEDNDEIMGIPIQLGVMICIKKNTIRKIHVTNPQSGADPSTWYADDPISFLGSPAQWSITQTPRGIIFLGWDHWYTYDGSGVKIIIDEFDTKEILSATYSDVVGFWHKGIFLAAYSDITIAAQYHNRIMRYNFKREALAIDFWTSSTVAGANCFAAKTGDDETGELYFGDSLNGLVVKDKESEEAYRLRTKTEANAGGQTDVFIGGTENSPYIEIGDIASATTIPDNICILWDSASTTPGTGWTEITGFDGRFINISTSAVGTTSDAVGISGTNWTDLETSSYRVFRASSNTETEFPIGSIIIWDQSSPPTGYVSVGETRHIRIDSTLASQDTIVDSATSGSGTAKNLDTFVSVFLIKRVGEADTWDGTNRYAYSLWYSDGATSNGWTDVTSSYDGYLMKGKTSGDLATTDGGDSSNGADFVQRFSGFSETSSLDNESTSNFNNDPEDGYDRNNSTYRELYGQHSGDGHLGMVLTHEHTWTESRYIGNVTTKSEWTTFGGNYKSNNNVTTVQLRVNGSWTTVGSQTYTAGGGSNSTLTQSYNLNSSTGWSNVTGIRVTLDLYAYSYEGNRQQILRARVYNVQANGFYESVSFRLARKPLGLMKDYNDAIQTTYTTGTWVAPAQQINAESLSKIFWNEDIDDVVNDNVLIHTRSGATEAATLAAPWSAALTDPNGSAIVSTADAWFQYKIEFTAADTTVTNPRVFFTNAYVVRYTYEKGNVVAEDSVNFIYNLGRRNFKTPMADKMFKKIGLVHEGTDGEYTFTWETNNNTNSFTIPLATNPERYDSYFQDTALGREIDFTVSKNDLSPFRLSEVKGIYSEHTVVL